jgi:hypothetical protein
MLLTSAFVSESGGLTSPDTPGSATLGCVWTANPVPGSFGVGIATVAVVAWKFSADILELSYRAISIDTLADTSPLITTTAAMKPIAALAILAFSVCDI